MTIPANGGMTLTFEEPGFTVVSASAPFYIRRNGGAKTKISQGQNVGSDNGPAFGKVLFSTDQATAVNVVIGDYGTSVGKVAPDVTGVTDVVIPFVETYWDTSGALGALGGIYKSSTPLDDPLPLSVNKPYRRIWCYFDATTFPNGQRIDMVFKLNGTQVLYLPVEARLVANYRGGLMNTKTGDTTNRLNSANVFFYQNADGSGTVYQLHPVEIYLVCDSVQLTNGNGAGVGGTMRAYLGVLSNENKF